ncbi:ribosome hibernation-promoting factor, HPF/YfiA family [Ancylobacter rudongensis]|uniref:Ribosome hibernation promoting factor n=1 Tax=Ancylobacter rudongensis TaxID=177413 RepID=A0A1G4RIW1_9HYPH|nr:ribosome-associated translation inhibitor RaiA [Ancylobacter rudongensis]RTM00321.1 ribosome-associated translation inhibitor RaiA [Ancylobacter aquaticus]SCW56706.1 ribosomal subunit interface protein [Ancylobacter rudongensis]
MPLRVSGKNLDVGEALRQRVSDRVAGAMDKYFDGGWSGHVTVAREGSGYRADCALHLDSGTVLQAHADAQDPYASADAAVERIETRLRRYKSRVKRRAGNGEGTSEPAPRGETVPLTVFSAPDHEDTEPSEGWCPTVVAEATANLPRLSVSNAVLELDFTGATALVFRHAGHGRINVVYRRGDGHVGWVDPPANALADEIH